MRVSIFFAGKAVEPLYKQKNLYIWNRIKRELRHTIPPGYLQKLPFLDAINFVQPIQQNL